MQDMLELFDPKDINKSASAYNAEKLDWLNAHYIKQSSFEKLENLLKDDYDLDISEVNNKEFLLEISKDRANTLIQLKDAIKKIIDIPSEYEKKGVKKFVKENTLDTLKSYIALLEENKNSLNSVEDIENITKPFIEQNELKFPQLFQPIRIALTGGTQAPSVYDIIFILGIDETIDRINSAIAQNFGKEIA